MSIYYRLDKPTDNVNPEGSKSEKLFPRIIRQDTMNTRELCTDAAKGTTLNTWEVEIALNMAIEALINNLKMGRHVTLDGFGTFSVAAKAIRPALQQGEIRSESIQLKKIIFRTSPRLLKHATSWKFVKSPGK